MARQWATLDCGRRALTLVAFLAALRALMSLNTHRSADQHEVGDRQPTEPPAGRASRVRGHRVTVPPPGSREDLGGHRWTFSESIADVDPSSWGGLLR